MNLREAILKEHSRVHTLELTRWIGNKPERIALLMQLFMEDEYRVVQRAAWIVSYVARAQPALMAPYLPRLVQRLQDPDVHIAVKRNALRIFQEIAVPEALHSDLMNACFDAVADPKEAIAVRAFALGILGKLSLIYPELKNEIDLLIEDELGRAPTAAFRSKARQVRQLMQKGNKL